MREKQRAICLVLWALSVSNSLAFEPENWLRVSWTHLDAMETTTTSHTTHPSPSLSARISTAYDVSADNGPEVEFARRFKSWLGFSVGARYFSVEVLRRERFKFVDRNSQTSYVVWYSHSERTRIAQISSDLTFHLLRHSRTDLRVGPVLGFSWYDDLYGRRVDDHFYYGLHGALGVPVQQRWRVFVGVELLFAGAEPVGRAEIDYDPRMIQFGFACRLDRD